MNTKKIIFILTIIFLLLGFNLCYAVDLDMTDDTDLTVNSNSTNNTNNTNSLVGLLISCGPFFFILDITSPSKRITIILANSDGCKEIEPKLNQLVAPDIGVVNKTATKLAIANK